jgi:hypothetical protein
MTAPRPKGARKPPPGMFDALMWPPVQKTRRGREREWLYGRVSVVVEALADVAEGKASTLRAALRSRLAAAPRVSWGDPASALKMLERDARSLGLTTSSPMVRTRMEVRSRPSFADEVQRAFAREQQWRRDLDRLALRLDAAE